jgi:hypothetical protein
VATKVKPISTIIFPRLIYSKVGLDQKAFEDMKKLTAEVRWDNASIPMQPVDKSTEEFEEELLFAQDPLTTDAERIQNIVESKYCPADLNKIASECHLLNC